MDSMITYDTILCPCVKCSTRSNSAAHHRRPGGAPAPGGGPPCASGPTRDLPSRGQARPTAPGSSCPALTGTGRIGYLPGSRARSSRPDQNGPARLPLVGGPGSPRPGPVASACRKGIALLPEVGGRTDTDTLESLSRRVGGRRGRGRERGRGRGSGTGREKGRASKQASDGERGERERERWWGERDRQKQRPRGRDGCVTKPARRVGRGERRADHPHLLADEDGTASASPLRAGSMCRKRAEV